MQASQSAAMFDEDLEAWRTRPLAQREHLMLDAVGSNPWSSRFAVASKAATGSTVSDVSVLVEFTRLVLRELRIS